MDIQPGTVSVQGRITLFALNHHIQSITVIFSRSYDTPVLYCVNFGSCRRSNIHAPMEILCACHWVLSVTVEAGNTPQPREIEWISIRLTVSTSLHIKSVASCFLSHVQLFRNQTGKRADSQCCHQNIPVIRLIVAVIACLHNDSPRQGVLFPEQGLNVRLDMPELKSVVFRG